MSKHELSALQQDFLRAFFQREDRFFLTGGAALVGFHLGHRETHDLDLFTLEDVIPEGMAAVAEVARELGGTLEALQTAPAFRRVLLRRGAEAIVIDLVREYVAQVAPDKPLINGVTQRITWIEFERAAVVGDGSVKIASGAGQSPYKRAQIIALQQINSGAKVGFVKGRSRNGHQKSKQSRNSIDT